MIYKILATGSDGNCVIINDTLMIDCGVPYKTVEPHLGALNIVLLTHLHGDHFNPATIRRMAYDKPSLRFGCCEWMVCALIAAGVKKTQIDVFDLDKWGTYNLTMRPWISPFKLTHNADNCGWRVWIETGGPSEYERLIYATDTGTLDGIEAKGYDLYMIEANHIRAELEARLAEKEANGEYAYERRAAENHLSMEQAMDWLADNMRPWGVWIPMHGHKDKEAIMCQESAITG